MPLEQLEARRLFATFWVDPVIGNNSFDGSSASPFKSITYALSRAVTPGDVVNLRSGVYRGENAKFVADGTADRPITLQAAPGATPVVKGSRLVTGFTLDSGSTSVYRAPWSYYFGSWNSAFTSTPQGNTAGMDARNKARNQFFSDGNILHEVPRRTDMMPGTFWVDSATQSVCLRLSDGSNPNGHVIEGTDTQDALLRTDGRDYLKVSGIYFMHNANPPQAFAAVRVDKRYNTEPSHDVLMENLSVSWASSAGLTVTGDHNTVLNCNLSDNGGVGFHSSEATNSTVEGGQWLRNNLHPGKQFDKGWEAGGSKISLSNNFTVNGVEASGNAGPGIWFDVENHNAVISNNRAYNNLVGIHYEISYTGLIYNNICYQNTAQGQSQSAPVGLGIYISSSAGCRVIHNTVWGNDSSGILVGGGDGRTDSTGTRINSYATQVFNNVVLDNGVGYYDNKNIGIRTNPTNLGNPKLAYAPNTSDYNLFYLTSGGGTRQFFWALDANSQFATLAQWRSATGFDQHSAWGNPRLSDPFSGDFHLEADTAAKNVATLRPEAPVDADGLPRIAGSVDAGVYQVERVASLPPKITQSQFQFASGQSVQLGFSQSVAATLTASDIQVTDLTHGKPVAVAVAYDVIQNLATITFPGGILEDANFKLGVSATGVSDTLGQLLDGDANGIPGGDFTFKFYFLNGDINRDRKVTTLDLNALAGHFGLTTNQVFSDGDLNYDHRVDSSDFTILLSRYGKTLPDIVPG